MRPILRPRNPITQTPEQTNTCQSKPLAINEQMKRNTNAVFKAFNDAIVSELANAGITPARQLSWHEQTPEFEIDTPAGKYTFFHGLNPDPDDKRPLNYLEVMGRFEDPVRARAHGVNCNQFNGKWNHDAPLHVATEADARTHAFTIVTRILSV